jgi:membrane protein implicated in regulation of membrane protease activity
MLIVALVLAVIGLAALVTAVVTSNELIAWVCIAASVIGVLLLIVDAVRERSHDEDGADDGDDVDDGDDGAHADDATTVMEPVESAEDYPEEPVTEVSEPVGVSNDKTDDGAADPAKND